MKKLIAIAVVFALVMGGVFAEISVGGGVSANIILGQGLTGDDKPSTADGWAGLGINVSGQNEDGTFGGNFGFGANSVWHGTDLGIEDAAGNDVNNGTIITDTAARIWWKPIEQVQIQFGSGSYWAYPQIGDAGTGWGFYAGFNDLNVWSIADGYGLDSGDGMGFYLTVTPISGLDIDLKIPFWGEDKALTVYQRFYAQVGYNINNIGTVKAAYKSNTGALAFRGLNDKGEEDWLDDHAQIGLSFALSAIPSVNLGFALITGIPTSNEDQNLLRTYPLNLSVGAGFNAADFNVKLRFAGEFFGKTTNTETDDVVKNNAAIKFGVYPGYTVGSLFVGLGVDVKVEGISSEEDAPDAKVSWHVAPHIKYSVGSGYLMAGLNVGAPEAQKDALKWSIPLRMGFDF